MADGTKERSAATHDTLQRALTFVQTLIMLATAAGLFVIIGRRDEVLNNVVDNTGKLTAAVATLVQTDAKQTTEIEYLNKEVGRLRDALQHARP